MPLEIYFHFVCVRVNFFVFLFVSVFFVCVHVFFFFLCACLYAFYFFQVGCYKTNIENRFKAKLQVCSSYEAINIIRKKLSNSQTSLFQKSIFGRFLDLHEFKIQNQLLHHLFFHEIY